MSVLSIALYMARSSYLASSMVLAALGVASGLFIACSQNDCGVRGGRYVFLEAATDLHQLRQALHGEKKRGFRATRCLQDLCKVPVAERGELV